MKKTILIICATIIITVICCSIVFFIGFNEGQNKTEINQNISNKEEKELEKFIGVWKYKSCEYDLDEFQIQTIKNSNIEINNLKYDINSTAKLGDWAVFINNDRLLLIYPENIFDKTSTFKIGVFQIDTTNSSILMQVETTDDDITFIDDFSKQYFSIANYSFEKLKNYNIIYEK